MELRACSAYSLNHPAVHLWRNDIRDVSIAEIMRQTGLKFGQLDLLGGCPPCQGFSALRTYNGSRKIQDEQNDLIFSFQRLVTGLGPKHVMLENVPALLDDWRFEAFRQTLELMGYDVKAKILDVAEYAVPQRRRRLVMLASRVKKVDFAPASKKRKTVRDAIGCLPVAGDSGDALHDMPENRAEHVKKMIAAVPKDGGSRRSLPAHMQLECHKESDGFWDVYGRMAWDAPSPTITTGCFNPSKGRFLHPAADRAITMREAAMLQSFPRHYRFPIEYGKIRLATMIGNALPPEFIRRHTKKLLAK